MNFNPRTPCGVRRERNTLYLHFEIFQSTHPLRGATGKSQEHEELELISIHAPLAGCDMNSGCSKAPQKHFNPRTPCGVRRYIYCTEGRPDLFQSTHPLRGATRCRRIPTRRCSISIHAPLAGCDPVILDEDEGYRDISIHAPLAGCD